MVVAMEKGTWSYLRLVLARAINKSAQAGTKLAWVSNKSVQMRYKLAWVGPQVVQPGF